MSEVTQAEVKSLTLDDLEYIFGDKYAFQTTPRIHQYASILWALYRGESMFLHGIGTGKTLTAIYTSQVWDVDRVLVVCPTTVMKTWYDQIEEHTSYTYALLQGEGRTRKMIVENDFSKFHIINYEGLRTVWGRKIDAVERGKKGSKYVPDHDAINRSPYDCIIWDEFHRLKSWGALQTQISYALARYTNKRIMLSGTPLAKSIQDFWSELMILDDGKTLGDDQFVFLHTYMQRIEMESRGRKFYEWFPKKDATQKIIAKVAQVAIRYDVSECADLPDLIEQKRMVQPSEEQRKLRNAIVNDLKEELEEGKINLKNVINKSAKLAQISGGFYYDDVKQPVYLKTNPKADELIEMLMTEVQGKCIVYHNFIPTGRLIEERLRKAKIKFCSLRGEVKNKAKQINLFQHDERYRVMVAHPKSGGEGLNFQVANVIIFFEQVYSGSILRPQCIGRIWRSGQEEPCVVVDLLQEGKRGDLSIDEKIFSSARTKRDLAKEILDWIRDN